MATRIELPMAIAGCGLIAALRAQVERYRVLGALAKVRRRSAFELTAQFSADPDPWSSCARRSRPSASACSFFTLDYAPRDRRLTVAV